MSNTQATSVEKFSEGHARAYEDVLAVEEPLEIRLDFETPTGRQQRSISITMRTPGNDEELAVGFLLTEGVIRNREDVIRASHCGPPLLALGHSNVLKVELSAGVAVALKSLDRNFYTTSSCGVCGKSSVDALKTENANTRALHDGQSPAFSFPRDLIPLLSDRLREAQKVFNRTGGLHASGIFSEAGELLVAREDVGRHNALDKVIGAGFLGGLLPYSQCLLMLSGRISFELVQKAAMAGIPMIAAVGAPSSLALELARAMNITLIGFVRGQTYNVYNRGDRLR